MLRQVFLIVCLFFIISAAYGQDQLTGRVFENKTKVFLQGIKVEDLKSHAITTTQTDGSFILKAAIGDVVCFSNYNYNSDTLYVTSLNYTQVFLDLHTNMLNEVKITNQEIKGNAGFNAQPEVGPLNSKTVTYQTDGNGNYIGGIKMRIFDGGETQKEHEGKVNAKESRKQAIQKTFSADNLKKYLPLTGQEMENFIIVYMPDENTYYSDGFNLVSYLNTSYEEFLKIPVENRQSKTYFQLKAEN